ncbi:MAG: DMT family transporter [Nocardioidaceae bacterium]
MWLATFLLAVAISIEVLATAALPRTHGFTDLQWTVLVIIGYAVAIGLLAVVVRHISVSVTYAVWSGAGTALVAIIGALFLDEQFNAFKVVGIALIIAGVVALNLHGAN